MKTLKLNKTQWFIEPLDEDANQAVLENKKAIGKQDEGYWPNRVCHDGKPHRLWESDFLFIAQMLDSKKVRHHKFRIYNQEHNENEPKRWVPIPLKGFFKYILLLHKIRPNVDENVRNIFKLANQLNSIKGRRLSRMMFEAPYIFTMEYLASDDREIRVHGLSMIIQMFVQGRFEEVWLYGPNISEGMEKLIDMAILFGIPIMAKSDGTNADYDSRW